MKRTAFCASALVLGMILLGSAVANEDSENPDVPSVGPARGVLLLAGGAVQNPAIFETFLELAGGPEAPIVVIPTAGGAPSYSQDSSYLRIWAHRLGSNRLTMLHTYDREEANSEEFVAPLREARGVWFSGGRQWRLADSYLDTRVHRELQALLDRGGVIGGSSAGATIQGSYLARGDTKTNTVMMGDHEQGLAFLKDVAVDQHLLRHNRHFDLLEIIEAHPHLLGIGLDEDTAIVVRGDRFEVIGSSYVAIYDRSHKIDSGGDFYFLSPGDRYDLKKREPTRNLEPLGRVVKKTSRGTD